MNTGILTKQSNPVKVRPNLWQASDGAVIGFGAILAPGGLYYCFSCNVPNCEHTTSVDEAWVSGQESVEDEIPFDGMIFASSAGLWPDDYGLSEVTL